MDLEVYHLRVFFQSFYNSRLCGVPNTIMTWSLWIPGFIMDPPGRRDAWQSSNIGSLLSLSLGLACCPWFLCRSFPCVCQSFSASLISYLNVLQHFCLFLFSLPQLLSSLLYSPHSLSIVFSLLFGPSSSISASWPLSPWFLLLSS